MEVRGGVEGLLSTTLGRVGTSWLETGVAGTFMKLLM